ncbi:MAG: helical backbone metal receptor [Acidimicrobiales bacterium]
MRVVSLVPSVTETLLCWGVVPVGVTRWCEHPELAQVGGTKDPDIGAIVALGPDLVVMDEEENRRDDAARLEAAGCEVHALAIRSVADVGPQLAALAARVGRADRWEPPRSIPFAGLARRVFVPIWRERRAGDEPLFTTVSDDTYGATLLAAAGMDTVYAGDAARYPVTTLAEAASRRPDVVLAPSEPYKFTPRHQPELERVAPVVFVDGQDLFWWGARTAAALCRLRDLSG